jgi:hypothetical protein
MPIDPADTGAESESEMNVDNFIMKPMMREEAKATGQKRPLEEDAAATSGAVPKRPRCT